MKTKIFNIGDVVVLNSGGPQMTVVKEPETNSTSHTHGYKVYVTYSDDKNNIQTAEFNSLALKLHKANVIKTGIYLVLDKSGSMQNQVDKTISGYNKFVEEQKTIEGEALLSTILFDGTVSTLFTNKNIKNTENLTNKQYVPSGGTALLDAIGETMNRAKRDQESLKLDKVVVAILTDGEENSSSDFTYAQCKALIEAQEAKGWDVLFLGANIDVAREVNRLGLKSAKAVNMSTAYAAGNLDAVYSAVSRGIGMSRGGVDLNGLVGGLECLVEAAVEEKNATA